MDEPLKNRIDNMTISEVLELCFFHALTNPEQHNDANSEEVMSRDADDSSDASQAFKELKLVDALSAHKD